MDWVRGAALALGGPGLFMLALLDSSFLSFPEVVDLLLVVMVTRHPERLLYYGTLATVGSIIGSYALYHVARKGGEAFLRRRFHDRHVDRTVRIFQKYGILSIAVAAILPPPVPLKAFVLVAGAAGVRRLDFVVAIALGRGVRYFGEGVLAMLYGERALDFVKENTVMVSLVLGIAVVTFAVAWIVWRRRHPGAETAAGD